MAWLRYSARPIVAPIFSPKDREMIKYSPPPSTRWFVAISDMAMAVGMVTRCPSKIMAITPMKPSVPIAKPKRRNNIAPNMVDIAVKNTGAVPKPCDLLFSIDPKLGKK